VVVFFVARAIPPGRPTARLVELTVALISALLLGGLATALDFGGWNEPDWRAGVFVFLGSAAFVAAVRLMRMARRRRS
jgi:O-antigen ligase